MNKNLPLSNEQKALKQIINLYNQNQIKKLEIFFELINPELFTDNKKQNAKIFQALNYNIIKKHVPHNQIIPETIEYLQSNYPQENFTPETLSFLINDIQLDNLDFLDNLKHTYQQEQLYGKLVKFIQPARENIDPFTKDLYYKDFFNKLRTFVSLIPHNSDKETLTLAEMAELHPEFFDSSQESKEKIQEEYYRLSEKFRGLNIATKGFKRGELITIGGYTGLGKTTFVYNLLLDVAKTRYEEKKCYPHILVFSYEMSIDENLGRILAHETQIPLETIISKNIIESPLNQTAEIGFDSVDYLNRTEKAKQFFKKTNFKFSYEKSKNIDYVVDYVYRLHLEEKVEIVVIDHLQITKTTNHLENDRLAIDEIMTKLKQLAIELNIVIIILSQFSRDTYNNYQGKSPEITALKGSGGIETNSNIVLMMSEFQPKISKDRMKTVEHYENNKYKDLYDKGIAKGEDGQKIFDNETIIEVAIKKNRNGVKNTLLYHFEMNTQTFQEVACVKPQFVENF
ncbi:replicative DNA helicase [Candidatus Phytoplasma solani]|uniref:Replicative DNA helicase n=1 Tax=Candidatus Phytoplasma solani TaxID=69896 RepID=A0A421NU95_9MOLU|nr:DnaB-like helicase C-terminal domain-containing protein [Candidatus Phytoplasma solani]RMI87601.1 replicative DNA helicase [Candidatus Phytoplasma solani]